MAAATPARRSCSSPPRTRATAAPAVRLGARDGSADAPICLSAWKAWPDLAPKGAIAVMATQPLSPPQVRAIEALLAHETQAEAAKAARVGQRSIRRWLAQDGFRAALARQRNR